MSDARRARLRRILLVASLPFAICALVLAAKLASLSVIAGLAIDSHERGGYESSVERSDDLFLWNYFEPWIAPFNRGTANAAAGYYTEAIDDLEVAFASAPAARRCDVAVNLSLSWERLGDSYADQGLFAGAARLFETAEAVIDAAGPECEPPNAPRNDEENRDPGDELLDARERLQGKRGVAEQFQADGGGEPPRDLEGRLDDLEQQNDDAAGEKAERQQDRERLGDPLDGDGGFDGGEVTERPW